MSVEETIIGDGGRGSRVAGSVLRLGSGGCADGQAVGREGSFVRCFHPEGCLWVLRLGDIGLFLATLEDVIASLLVTFRCCTMFCKFATGKGHAILQLPTTMRSLVLDSVATTRRSVCSSRLEVIAFPVSGALGLGRHNAQ